MNPADIAIKYKLSSLVLTVLFIFGGLAAYRSMSRLEDPEFTIKDAKVITTYPGASAREVEEEVTEVLEKAIQQLGQLKYIESISRPGLSNITVTIKDKYDKSSLPQVWDELRRKVGDVQGSLPPGAGPAVVNDDFGDVFGVYFAITGDGFTYKELKDYADVLERELLLCTDVAKVTLSGVQDEVIYVEISRARLAALGISEKRIYDTLAGKNLLTPSGRADVGKEYIRIVPTGEVGTVESIGNVVVEGLLDDRTIFLRDVADIWRGYADPENTIVRMNGRRGIGIGISTVSGGNVVTMGQSVDKRLRELELETPIGMERTTIYDQPGAVTLAVSSFVVSLVQALLIVIGILLLAMGLRSGLLIGFILLLTIFATLMLMKMNDIAMERISLGALIIALGMLVDNAIVVTDGILIGIQQGKNAIKIAGDVVKRTMWPLLGATVVAILAFAAIGLSDDKTGEYCRSLFAVILYSLGLSWLFAVTVTPLYCVMFLKADPDAGDRDPYAGAFFVGYRKFLGTCIRHRWVTLGLLVVLLIYSLQGFAFVDKSFFPDSTTPKFTVDVWTTEGQRITNTEKDIAAIEEFALGVEGVESVFASVGQGTTRFLLTYTPEDKNSAYGQLIVAIDDADRMPEVMGKIEAFAQKNLPDVLCFAKPFVVGPGGGSDVELRIRGADHAQLRQVSEQVKDIFRADPDSRDVRDDWREKVLTLRPVLAEPQTSRAGLTRAEIAYTLQKTYGGLAVGLYREGDDLIPIMARAPVPERIDADQIKDMQIWSPVAQRSIPLRQVVSSVERSWEDNIVARRDRLPTITPQCNAREGSASALFARVRPIIEAMPVPAGVDISWGGEYEDSADGQAALMGQLPTTILMMILIVILLFNALRQPAIIWLCVPLALIGVSVGLLLTGESFNFMAILGLLSLIGMLIKNAVVLIDETDQQIKDGKPGYQATVDAAVSRLRPVGLAAATTVLGMIPLLPDAFFSALAVTVMAGLAFATVLTLVVVPTLYATFFGLREGDTA